MEERRSNQVPGGSVSLVDSALSDTSAGKLFQFPERHFIGNTLSAELTAGWPVAAEQFALRQALAVRTQEVMAAVGLQGLPLDAPLANLSDGYKR